MRYRSEREAENGADSVADPREVTHLDIQNTLNTGYNFATMPSDKKFMFTGVNLITLGPKSMGVDPVKLIIASRETSVLSAAYWHGILSSLLAQEGSESSLLFSIADLA